MYPSWWISSIASDRRRCLNSGGLRDWRRYYEKHVYRPTISEALQELLLPCRPFLLTRSHHFFPRLNADDESGTVRPMRNLLQLRVCLRRHRLHRRRRPRRPKPTFVLLSSFSPPSHSRTRTSRSSETRASLRSFTTRSRS